MADEKPLGAKLLDMVDTVQHDRRPVIAIDFDGVIHDYTEGWQDGSIYGNLVPGFFEWVDRTKEAFRLVVYSSRSKTSAGVRQMSEWLMHKHLDWCREHGVTPPGPFLIEFEHEKPAAWVTIDDRVIRFDGDWEAAEISVEALRNFRPWNK